MRTMPLAVLLTCLAAPAFAQGWIEHPRIPSGPQVERLRSAVDVRIVGRVAHVRVEEWFRNDGGGLGEGDYLYPLPGEAVFSQFSLFQGDEELRGEMMDAATARTIYEEIVRRKRDPALIELVGHGLVRARVFPIAAGETRKITLRYTQVLRRSGDALVLRYAAGGRYRGVGAGETAAAAPRRAPIALTVAVEAGSSFADPFSPTHELTVDRDGAALRARVVGEISGDVAILLPFARPLAGVSVMTHRPSDEDGYFMMTLSPGTVRGPAVPRDVTVVLDISGSMSGSKVDQAKRAIRQLLASLDRGDRFRLLAFNGAVRHFRTGWSPGAGDAVAAGMQWTAALATNGGTNIAGALQAAFDVPSTTERLGIVLFLTDGLPSVGEEDPERIAAAAEGVRGNARVFAFGVGHDVNTYLLDRLSAAGRGSTAYVEPGEDVETALGTLVAKIQHPVLTDLRLLDAPAEIVELYPRTLPDLFAGDDLVVFGRFRSHGAVTGAMRLAGRRNGREERFGATVTFPAHRDEHDFIASLWAARKIGELSRDLRLEGHSDALVDEIRRTALRYGLLSEYTSYLVQEPDAFAAAPAAQGRTGIVPAARAPQLASGGGAVRVAEQARVRRESKSMADLGAADERMLAASSPVTASERVVAGRRFRRSGTQWNDVAAPDGVPAVTFAAFSPAYFAVLAALPELQPFAAAFAEVTIGGEGIVIGIAADGTETLAADAVPRLVRAFRGP